MRVAILSDIHGNSIALDALLADIKSRGGADEYWVLGDLAALGHDPCGALQRLYALPNVHITRGNTDRYLVTGERPYPHLDDIAQDPSLLQRYVEVAQSFAWTQGAITRDGWQEQLAQLPLEFRYILPDGTRVLGVHAAPGTDDGAGIHPRLTTAELESLIADSNADLVLVGHTHWAMDIRVGEKRVVNLGSVSLAPMPDLRAKYTLLQADANGCLLEHHLVDYDRQAVISALNQIHHPAGDFIIQFMRGEKMPAFSKGLSAAEAEHLGLPVT